MHQPGSRRKHSFTCEITRALLCSGAYNPNSLHAQTGTLRKFADSHMQMITRAASDFFSPFRYLRGLRTNRAECIEHVIIDCKGHSGKHPDLAAALESKYRPNTSRTSRREMTIFPASRTRGIPSDVPVLLVPARPSDSLDHASAFRTIAGNLVKFVVGRSVFPSSEY